MGFAAFHVTPAELHTHPFGPEETREEVDNLRVAFGPILRF